jgi:hypothetical protein
MSLEKIPSSVNLVELSEENNYPAQNQTVSKPWMETAMITSVLCTAFFFSLTIAPLIAVKMVEDPSDTIIKLCTDSSAIGAFGVGLGLISFVALCLASFKPSPQQIIELSEP